MQIKAVIHDWDDTITGSFEAYSKAYVEFGEFFNIEGGGIDSVRIFWGGTMADILSGVYPTLSRQEVEEKLAIFMDHLNTTQKVYSVGVFPQVKETFDELHGRGVMLGVISSGVREEIERIYREHISPSTEKHLFIYDHNDTGYRKPDPRVFDKAVDKLSSLGISEDETIYIGDSFHDYHAARDRGITFYAVTTGLKTREDFLNEGLEEEFILSDFRKILDNI